MLFLPRLSALALPTTPFPPRVRVFALPGSTVDPAIGEELVLLRNAAPSVSTPNTSTRRPRVIPVHGARITPWLKFLHALSWWEVPRRHVVHSVVVANAAIASGTFAQASQLVSCDTVDSTCFGELLLNWVCVGRRRRPFWTAAVIPAPRSPPQLRAAASDLLERVTFCSKDLSVNSIEALVTALTQQPLLAPHEFPSCRR